MVFNIGLTGTIASGKSTVAQMFADLGLRVISADLISKQLTLKGTPAYDQIVDHFGIKVIQEDKELNRRLLRDLIFSNPKERLWLENLLHPLIRKEIETQVKVPSKSYSVIEIPLLIDKKPYPFLDQIVLVTAPWDIQLLRIMKRDQCDKKAALAILSVQPELGQQLKISDHIITNDSDLNTLQKKVNHLHHLFSPH